MMKLLCGIILALITSACSENYVPKPRGYYRISFPEKEYIEIELSLPYKFEKASYSILEEIPAKNNQSWINVTTLANKADLHLSYETLNKDVDKHIEEARRMAYDHTIKADAIDEKLYTNYDDKVFGIVYYIKGNAASPMQFFLTDSTKNFIRGALYIRETPNVDSIQPVIDFLELDVIHLIETFKWN